MSAELAVQPIQPRLYRKYRDVGKFAIFYHPNVKDQDPLEGTKKDAANLMQAAKSLGFDVDEPHCNLNSADLFEKLDSYAKMDHTNSTCFAVAITGHGTFDNTLLASDGIEYDLSTVLNKFRSSKCPSLKGKPKLFFIDTCRGTIKDANASTDSRSVGGTGGIIPENTNKILTVPVAEDFLVAHATYPGYVAYVILDSGSMFTSNLCTVLQNKDLSDIIDILTFASHNTAINSVQDDDPQMPSFTSQLTAAFHLRVPLDSLPPRTELLSYNMENPRRGHLYIFSNERNDDVKLLEDSGINLGFRPSHHGLNEMMDTGKKYVSENYTDHDCLVCVIITYSKTHDELYVGKSETRHLKDFVALFHAKKNKIEREMPKIFIVQAPYRKVTSNADQPIAPHTIPETADSLIVYSTSPEKSGNRTLFIEEFCRQFKRLSTGLDLLQALTLVMERMSQVVGLHVPTVTSQLRKKVVFK